MALTGHQATSQLTSVNTLATPTSPVRCRENVTVLEFNIGVKEVVSCFTTTTTIDKSAESAHEAS